MHLKGPLTRAGTGRVRPTCATSGSMKSAYGTASGHLITTALPRSRRSGRLWACPGSTDIQDRGRSPEEDVHGWTQAMQQWRRRRAFTTAFKAEVVELCRKGDRSSQTWRGIWT